MKKLFLTTAILTISTLSANANAVPPSQATTFSAAEFTQMIEAVQTTSTAVGLHTGDFQAITKTANIAHFYKGDGSSLMVTTRMYRD